MNKKTIIILNTSKGYGGWEFQTLNLAKQLQQKFNIVVIYSSINTRFEKMIKKNKEITSESTNYYSRRLSFIFNFFSFAVLFKLNKIICTYKPVLIIACQGYIEASSIIYFLKPFIKPPIISYIPICEYLSKSSRYPSIGKIKDLINIFYFKLPSSFITISRYQKKLIKSRCKNKNVTILPILHETKNLKIYNKYSSREKLGFFDANVKLFGLPGRFTYQKGFDIFLELVVSCRSDFDNVTFVIVGDGDLKDTLSEYIANNNISHLVQLLEFQNNVSLFYSAIDGLIMPARYEGIPHNILLDAIQLRIPLIMSNISDANQYLPINNLFDPFNPKNFMETLQQFIYKPDDFIVYTDLGKHSYKSYRNNINKLFGKETIAAS